MEKYAILKAAGFLSPEVIEPGDMTTAMVKYLLHEVSPLNPKSDSVPGVSYQMFRLIRSVELGEELDNRTAGQRDVGLYDFTTPGFGVSSDQFDPEEFHPSEWPKSIDRFTRERDLILRAGIKAPARLVFIEIRVAEFKKAIRQVALAA